MFNWFTVMFVNQGLARQGQFRVFLCYCPFLQETEGTIADIMEYILAVVDYQEESLMRTCYEMYNMALQEGTTHKGVDLFLVFTE